MQLYNAPLRNACAQAGGIPIIVLIEREPGLSLRGDGRKLIFAHAGGQSAVINSNDREVPQMCRLLHQWASNLQYYSKRDKDIGESFRSVCAATGE